MPELVTAVQPENRQQQKPVTDTDDIQNLNMAIADEDVRKAEGYLNAGVSPMNVREGVMSPLTVLILRWTAPNPNYDAICKLMLEHGADPAYKIPYKSLAQVIEEYGSEELKEYYKDILQCKLK